MERSISEAISRLKKAKVEAFEVMAVGETSLVIEAKRQMVDIYRRSSSLGLGIRVVADGRMGWSATRDLASKEVGLAVQRALDAMRSVGPSEEALIPNPQDPQAGFTERLDRPLGDIPDEDKIRTALALESAAVACDSRISRVWHPRYEERVRHVCVANSKGISVSAARGLASCQLTAVAADGGQQEKAYEFDFSPHFDELDPSALARLAASRAVGKLGGRRLKAGPYPVILESKAASSLVRLLAPSFFADHVQRGKSVLADKRGKKFYSPIVNIVDDGLLPGGFGSFPFDAEGIPKRATVMVGEGVVGEWLYDGARAARDGMESTGNAVRDELRRPPAIGVGNCFLKPGSTDSTSLTKEMGCGLLVTDLLGTHTANPISGDFSFGAEGFIIENGMVDYPIRGVTIAGNVHRLFGQVAGVGNDLRFIGAFGAPSVFVEELMLGG